MMDKKLLTFFLLLVTVLVVAFAGCTSSEAPVQNAEKVYIVGIDMVYPPFSMIDEDGRATGFDVESMEWIAENQGFDVEFKPMGWDGIIPALLADKIDMVYSGMTITEERKEKVAFSKPYWTVNQAVVVGEDSEFTLDDIKAGKATIGTQRGCTAQIWLEENLINTGTMDAESMKLYDNSPLAVADLINGRVDAVMYDSTVVADMINGKPVKNVGFIETNEQFGIAVRPDDTELLSKLNAGLDNLVESDHWQELIEKYNMM